MRVARFVFAAILVAGIGTATTSVPAFAQDTPDYVGSNPPEGGTSVSGAGESRGTSTGTLPITGADIAVLVTLAVALTAIGWVFLRAARTSDARQP